MKALFQVVRKYAACESAVATIEAAVVLPFVLLLGVGTIEFGWVLSQVQAVQVGLRDSVRYVSRCQLVMSNTGAASLSGSAVSSAYGMMDQIFQSNGITSKQRSISLISADNTNGSLYLGGAKIYSINGTASFTPASAGLLAIFNVTLPVIHLHYETRHVGG